MPRGEDLLDFQLRRIRFALFQAYSYKQVQIDSDKEDQSREAASVAWHDIADSINDAVGIEASKKEKENFGERLRAFVIGNTNKQTGEIVRTTPQRIDDIIFYLLQEETYLTKSELESFIPDQQAAIRVHEFLDSEYDVGAGSESGKLKEDYVAYRLDPGGMLEVSILSLKYVPYVGHYTVHEHVWRLDCGGIDRARFHKLESKLLDELKRKLFGELESKLRNSLQHKHLGPGDDVYSGWALEAYDGNVVIFLKDQQVDMNKFYLALYNDPPNSGPRDRANRLLVVERSSPLYFLRKEQKEGQSPITVDLTALSGADLMNYIQTDILPNDLKLFLNSPNINDVINEIKHNIEILLLNKKEIDDIVEKKPKFMFWPGAGIDSDLEKISTAEEDIQEASFEFLNWGEVADVYLAHSHRESVDPRELAREVMRAARENNQALIEKYVAAGFPINFQEHDTGQTLLHSAAVGSARDVIKFLEATGKCDFAVRSRKGYCASEIAYHIADDYELAQELQTLERAYSEAKNTSDNGEDIPQP